MLHSAGYVGHVSSWIPLNNRKITLKRKKKNLVLTRTSIFVTQCSIYNCMSSTCLFASTFTSSSRILLVHSMYILVQSRAHCFPPTLIAVGPKKNPNLIIRMYVSTVAVPYSELHSSVSTISPNIYDRI